ncbi:MAG: hypothetical protein ACH36H_07830 [Candidatus Nanopelagicales bacterium]
MSDSPAARDDVDLLRAFEPVVRFTKGEMFFPVGVSDYVDHAALWQSAAGSEATMTAEAGDLDLTTLAVTGAQAGGPGQALSVVNTGHRTTWRERLRLRDHREHLKGGSRLAEVGVLGRTIDSISRLSLLFRGSVAGGSAAGSMRIQNEHLDPDRPVYYGRVVRDAGYLICQYWFFYSFNNWRSGFGGVNEHEADWEQVTIYLDGTGATDDAGLPIPRWVVFSAHDETGDDLRRRWDDPDLTLVDGRHPVVFAGAGSHSGAYLAGDYLITLQPPNLGGVVTVTRKISQIFTPWSNSARGVGVPYIDYARGDGRSIGPKQPDGWSPTLIDDSTGWVVDYRGLWGHDTHDRLGGERGPAGPRYERDGTVRPSWADPVGWAGLAKVAPNPELERELMARRVAEIDVEIEGIHATSAVSREDLRTKAAGIDPAAPEVRALRGQEDELLALNERAVALADERARLVSAAADGIATPAPHAHLSHRLTPIQPGNRTRERLLGVWAIVSTPLILWMFARLVMPTGDTRTSVLVAFITLFLSVEAIARGYFLAFLVRAGLVIGAGVLLFYAFENLQLVAYWTFVSLAVLVLLVNLRDVLRR